MIKLGQRVIDRISGFQGIATGRCTYLNGCVQFQIEAEKMKEDGDRIKARWIDQQQLEVIDDGLIVESSDVGGGNRSHPE